jgi:uroporphyrinogen decarboxylase
MQPINSFDMSAAIIFADILLVPHALGIDLKFETGEGPKLGKFEIADLHYDATQVQPVFDALKLVRAQLPSDKSLIGFAGSPWTVATYMIEGGSSKTFEDSKQHAFSNSPKLNAIIDILVESTIEYLSAQIYAGADVVKLFDSWAGELTGADFARYIIEPNARIIEGIRARHPKTKIIAFPRRAMPSDLLNFCQVAKPDAIAISEHIDIRWAVENLALPIQGNLPSATLLCDKQVIRSRTQNILEATRNHPFIFNLGHGISQHTPPENVAFLCEILLDPSLRLDPQSGNR